VHAAEVKPRLLQTLQPKLCKYYISWIKEQSVQAMLTREDDASGLTNLHDFP
jgi:hypothetical protein